MNAAAEPPQHRWVVPVLDARHERLHDFLIFVAHQQVVLVPPFGDAYVLPISSDDKLCDAVRAARDAIGAVGL